MANNLPNTLQNSHITALDEVVQARLAAFPVEVVLTNFVDIVPASLLPYLAKQFDILGIKGYALATTEQERRDILSRAIEFHRLKGTPFAIKEALRLFGYPGAEFIEGISSAYFYNGTYNHSGAITYGGGQVGWAVFDVVFPAAIYATFTAPDLDRIRAIVEEYKPVRCVLRRITVSIAFTDTVAPTDTIELQADITSADEIGAFYNGAHTHNGTNTHDTYSEDFNATT